MAVFGGKSCDNAFWQFSLVVYTAPGVAQECLALQERYGVDVNVLLFCAWLACARQVTLTPHDIDAVRAQVGAWHERVVKSLRVARRYMKTVPGGHVAALRGRVKVAELEAEQIEQAILFGCAEERWPAGGAGPLADILRENLETYLRTQGYRGAGGDAMPVAHLCAAVTTMPAEP